MTSYAFGCWLKEVFEDDQKAERLIANPGQEMEMRQAGLSEAQTEHMHKILETVPPEMRRKAVEVAEWQK